MAFVQFTALLLGVALDIAANPEPANDRLDDGSDVSKKPYTFEPETWGLEPAS